MGEACVLTGEHVCGGTEELSACRTLSEACSGTWYIGGAWENFVLAGVCTRRAFFSTASETALVIIAASVEYV